uniref:Uncharacterized protein n=1 Tax=viral metagenome TaxID=1070528 RepID=A0A6C0JRZ6_9ZZZZ
MSAHEITTRIRIINDSGWSYSIDSEDPDTQAVIENGEGFLEAKMNIPFFLRNALFPEETSEAHEKYLTGGIGSACELDLYHDFYTKGYHHDHYDDDGKLYLGRKYPGTLMLDIDTARLTELYIGPYYPEVPEFIRRSKISTLTVESSDDSPPLTAASELDLKNDCRRIKVLILRGKVRDGIDKVFRYVETLVLVNVDVCSRSNLDRLAKMEVVTLVILREMEATEYIFSPEKIEEFKGRLTVERLEYNRGGIGRLLPLMDSETLTRIHAHRSRVSQEDVAYLDNLQYLRCHSIVNEVYLPSLRTLVVSNVYGDTQFFPCKDTHFLEEIRIVNNLLLGQNDKTVINACEATVVCADYQWSQLCMFQPKYVAIHRFTKMSINVGYSINHLTVVGSEGKSVTIRRFKPPKSARSVV